MGDGLPEKGQRSDRSLLSRVPGNPDSNATDIHCSAAPLLNHTPRDELSGNDAIVARSAGNFPLALTAPHLPRPSRFVPRHIAGQDGPLY